LYLLRNLLTEQGYLVRPVCEQLKADERTRDIPIIFISVLQEPFDKVKAFSVGGMDYVTKPFQEEEVLAHVRTHPTLRQQHVALRAGRAGTLSEQAFTITVMDVTEGSQHYLLWTK
jgi:PleD family two-component response regulator